MENGKSSEDFYDEKKKIRGNKDAIIKLLCDDQELIMILSGTGWISASIIERDYKIM